MGACREHFNMFRNFESFKNIMWLIITNNKYLDKQLVYEDSFMPFVCKLKGHDLYEPDKINEPGEYACKRCHQFIKNK